MSSINTRLSLSVLFICFCGTWGFSVPYTLLPEERQAIENRKKIDKYHIEIASKYWELNDRPQAPMASVVGKTYYADGVNFRHDLTRKRGVTIKGEEPIYTTIWLHTKDQSIWYTRGINEYGQRCAVDIKPLGVDAPMTFVDVRTIGMKPAGFMFEDTIDQYIGHLDRKNNIATDDIFNGIPCKKIAFTYPQSGARVTYWIAPSKGYSVLCMMGYCEGKEEGKFGEEFAVTERTTVEVAEYKNSGLWFPIRANFTRTNEITKEIVMKHDFEITVHSLNEPLDPDFFTLKSFGIPVGTDVLIYPDSQDEEFWWDGYKVTSDRIAAFDDVTEIERSYRLSRILTIIVLNVIAVICLYFYFRNRSNNQKPPE